MKENGSGQAGLIVVILTITVAIFMIAILVGTLILGKTPSESAVKIVDNMTTGIIAIIAMYIGRTENK